MGRHSFFVTVPQYFNCMFFIPENLKFNYLRVPIFVKIPFQYKICPFFLRLPKFMKIKGPPRYVFNLFQTQGPNAPKCKIYNFNYISVFNHTQILTLFRMNILVYSTIDVIIVSFIENPVCKTYPLSNSSGKMNFVYRNS